MFFISFLLSGGIEFLSSSNKISACLRYLDVGIILNPLSFFMIISKKGLL